MPRTFALSAAVAVLLAGGAVTLAGASSPASGGKRHHVIHVTRDTGQDIYLDLDHSGRRAPRTDSVGDEDVYAANLYIGGKEGRLRRRGLQARPAARRSTTASLRTRSRRAT